MVIFSFDRLTKFSLRSLALVSKKVETVWLQTCVREVTLWNYQIPSFLLLLQNHPELGSQVRRLSFIARDTFLERTDHKMMQDLLSNIKHPWFEVIIKDFKNLMSKVDHGQFGSQLFQLARFIILEQCTNLTSFECCTSWRFPFYLKSTEMRPVLSSSNLKTLKMNKLDNIEHHKNLSLTGRQVLLLLISNPNLETASFNMQFTRQDAQVYETHLPPLLKAKRIQSKVRNLSLDVNTLIPEKKSEHFDYDKTFNIFLSIFKRLEDFTLEIYQDPDSNTSRIPTAQKQAALSQVISLDVLKGLEASSETLRSLSVVGASAMAPHLIDFSSPQASFSQMASRLKSFKNLNYFRTDSQALMVLCMGISFFGSCALEKLKCLEQVGNYELRSDMGNQLRNSEDMLFKFIERAYPPKSLKLVRSQKALTLPNNHMQLPLEQLDRKQFDKDRERVKADLNRKGVEFQLV